MGQKIIIHEVGLRDGLQNEAAFVPTTDKLALAGLLADAGLPRIELTSFVSPRWIPQLADHAEIAATIERREGVRYSALVPNRRGLEGAKSAQLEDIALFLSASEAHSKKNINKTIDEAIAVLSEVAKSAKEHGMWVRGYVSTVFGCPYEGAVDFGQTHELINRLFAMGVDEVSLGDTIGVANPLQVRQLMQRLSQDSTIKLDTLALHMHDTRGMALANCLAGLDAGVTIFDSAFGGLGGCPYAPGASGNLATEDLVYMLDGMGYDSGVDLDLLINASEKVGELISRVLPSKVLQSELAQRRKAEEKAAQGSS